EALEAGTFQPTEWDDTFFVAPLQVSKNAFLSQVAHGDVLFQRVDPDSVKDQCKTLVSLDKDTGALIPAHSESGHHHAFLPPEGMQMPASMWETGNIEKRILKLDKP